MESLAKLISDRLSGKSYCTVFGEDISRLWPLPKAEEQKRHNAIQAFAKKFGFSATIRDSGIRVIFKKLKV